MAGFAILRHEEGVSLDVERLVALYANAGEKGAEAVIARTVDDIGCRLAEIGRFAEEGRYAHLSRTAARAAALARTIGMATMARVALDVADASTRADLPALEATVARLFRVADAAMSTVWDLHRAVR